MSAATLSRYQVVKELGAGAMGRVSLALDTATGELVALKRLHEMVALQGGARLRRESKALERISHPNVVKVLGFGEEDNIPYLVMEYVRGTDLTQYITEKPTIDRIIQVFIGIANALAAVHGQGIIHRDLKPDNIRVTLDGEAKLMDFGLAKSLEGTVALTRAGAVVGTVLYMAPEQCRGAQLDYRADLYALGAVLFWALTGRPPFTGDGLAQVIMQHIQAPPPKPSSINPSIPQPLEYIVLKLMEKNPADRPPSALAVRDLLIGLSNQTMEINLSTEVARADALLIAPLIGRDAEMGLLMPLLEEPDPVYGVYAITGDVGTGKTRLIKAFSETARSSGTRFAPGEAIPDDPTPFGAISRMIGNLQKSNKNFVENLPEGIKGELARIVPSLGSAIPSDPNLPADVARLRLFEAFSEFLERVSEITVVVLENLHWADDSTLAALAHATRAVQKPRLLITYRLEDLPEGQTLPKGLARPRTVINLKPMSDDEMRELLQSWLDGDLDSGLETELVNHASGNPWVLEERLKAMLESGAIYRQNGIYQWQHAMVSLPESLNDLLAHRIQALKPETLEFARAASVLGRAWQYEDVRQLLEWGDDAALDALESLTRARLAQEIPGSNGEGFRFTHPLYSEILLDGIMSLKRRRLHKKAAMLLEHRASAVELANHHFYAEQYDLALEKAVEGGLIAQQSFAYPQAERAYRLALDASAKLATEPLKAFEARLHLGEVLSHTGRNDEAITFWQHVIDNAATLEGSQTILAQTRLKFGNVLRFSGSVDKARDIIGQYGIDDPFYEELEIEASHIHRLKKDFITAKHHGLEALRASRLAENPRGVARALLALAQLEIALDNKKRALRLSQFAVQIVEELTDDYLKTNVWNDLGMYHYILDQPKEVLVAWNKASEYAQKTGDVRARVVIQTNLALSIASEDDFEEARTRLKATREMAFRAGLYAQEKQILYNLAEMEYALGNLEVAREHFQDVKNSSYESPSKVWESRITLELGDGFVFELPELEGHFGEDNRRFLDVLYALSFGDYEKAYEDTSTENEEQHWFWNIARIHAAWRLGHDTSVALDALRQPAPPDTKLAPHLRLAYLDFVQQILLETNPERIKTLRILADKYRTSSIGLLARDVLLTLPDA
jgi:tetratricopeptide (TPR) repeat protein